MVASGLPEPRADHAEASVRFALDATEVLATMNRESGYDLGARIGIHSGAVVAGVIGKTKFIYDLWGDTVNIASRITDEARSGIILVDSTTYRRSRHQFEFEGPINVVGKGKGNIEVYKLIDLAAHLRPVTV